ncbi:MAG: NTP transferase domain-containing protein [Tepidiformaceae bacterium]
MHAVILAAGDGDRLGLLSGDVPKPLVTLGGRPIISYTLDALRECDIERVSVVTGYRETQLRAALSAAEAGGMSASFISNERFEEPASLSLRAAREACAEEPFLLVMADHVLSAPIVARLLDEKTRAAVSASFVAADRAEHAEEYTAEATKLALAAGEPPQRVVSIGKSVDGWSALDCGAFLLSPAIWGAVDAVPEACELSVIFTEAARRGELFAADVSGAFWHDIDTIDDLADAERLLALHTGA